MWLDFFTISKSLKKTICLTKQGGLYFCFLAASKTPEASIVFISWLGTGVLSGVREQNGRQAGELVWVGGEKKRKEKVGKHPYTQTHRVLTCFQPAGGLLHYPALLSGVPLQPPE